MEQCNKTRWKGTFTDDDILLKKEDDLYVQVYSYIKQIIASIAFSYITNYTVVEILMVEMFIGFYIYNFKQEENHYIYENHNSKDVLVMKHMVNVIKNLSNYN